MLRTTSPQSALCFFLGAGGEVDRSTLNLLPSPPPALDPERHPTKQKRRAKRGVKYEWHGLSLPSLSGTRQQAFREIMMIVILTPTAGEDNENGHLWLFLPRLVLHFHIGIIPLHTSSRCRQRAPHPVQYR